jgi:hypothetical protein
MLEILVSVELFEYNRLVSEMSEIQPTHNATTHKHDMHLHDFLLYIKI